MSSVPSPPSAKTDSMTTEPPSTVPKSTPMTVTMGSSALRRQWRSTICRSPTPLARAVRT